MLSTSLYGVFFAKLGLAIAGMFFGVYFCLTKAYSGLVKRRVVVANEPIVGLKAVLIGAYSLLWFFGITAVIGWYVYAYLLRDL